MAEGDSATPRVDGRYLVGVRTLTRAVRRGSAGSVSSLLVATDAPEHVVGPLLLLAAEHAIPVVSAGTAADLGHRCGLDRPVAAAGDRALKA